MPLNEIKAFLGVSFVLDGIFHIGFWPNSHPVLSHFSH
jgi:hypothetical protein